MTGLLTVAEAARVLAVSEDCVYRLCAAGLLAHHRPGTKGGAVRIAPADLDAYLRSCRRESRLPRGEGEGRKLKWIEI